MVDSSNPLSISEINPLKILPNPLELTATIAQLFEKQAMLTPNKIALVCGEKELTYKELDQQSTQLAQFLPIKPHTLIGICFKRSTELFIAILAILKSGAAFVPIDPDWPLERIQYVLSDTQSPFWLTTQQLINDWDAAKLPSNAIALDSLNYQSQPCLHQLANIKPSDLAYVIYTSGTTGTPKGVMIEHHSVINYFSNICSYFDDIESIDFSTSMAFDLSITTTLIPLLCGKTIYIYSGQLQEVEHYISHLQTFKIDFI